MPPLGEQFATAIGRRDRATLTAVLAAEVDFKGLTPDVVWESQTREEVVDIVLSSWFGPLLHIEEVVDISVGVPVRDTERVGYRFNLTNSDGPQAVEQQAYYRLDAEGRIAWLRLVCSGLRPRALTG